MLSNRNMKDMKHKRISIITAITLLPLLAFVLILGSCSRNNSSDDASGKISVFVSILPQKSFVEKISGGRVDVKVMVPPGKSPATYEPTPRQIVDLGAAKLFFSIGVAFENAFIPTIQSSLPGLQIVPTDAGIEKRHIEGHTHDEEAAEEDSAEDEHDEDEEEAPDPHIWMDPLLVKIQAETIRDALIRIDPAGEDVYRRGFADFASELDSLHAELTDLLAPFAGETLFVYHPAFGYFCDRYGLEQAAIETGGKEPSPAQLEEVVEHALEEGVQLIFVQPEFPEKSARAVADAIHGAVVPVAPLSEDYFASMQALGREAAEGLKR